MNDFLDLVHSLGPENIRLMNDSSVEAIQRKLVRTSGVLAIDHASGIGGFPKNRSIEIFGNEGSGKTTLCMIKCAVETKLKKYVEYIDVEHALNIEYAKALGVDMDYFALSQPRSAEEAGDLMLKAARTKGCSLVVLDSIAQLDTEQSIASELGDANIGTTARFMKALCLKLPGVCSVHQTLIIFTNQNREKPGVLFGNPVYQPGGRAVKHASSMRIELYRKSTNKEKDVAISNTTRVKFVKNKLGMPYTECEFDLIFGIGADNAKTAIELGTSCKVLTKKGNSFYLNGTSIGNGIKKAKETISNNYRLYQEIRRAILKSSIREKVQPAKNEEVPRTQGEDAPSIPVGKMRRVLLDA